MRKQWLVLLLCGACNDGGDTDTEDSGIPELACNEIDADGDGSNACDDCDDMDAERHPLAEERCNGVDDNCDDLLGWAETDDDGDSVLDCQLCDSMGFWQAIDQASPGDLASALADAMDGHECREYSVATDYMFVNLDKIDGQVECVYTGRTVAVSNQKPDGSDMNTEHTWPQSAGADLIPAKCDLNHLFPADALANTKRGSQPFGEVVSGVEWSEGGSTLGDDVHGKLVFEPRDSHKGNVARAMLYFEFRYAYRLDQEQVGLMLDDERRAMFLDWHASDPPDERDRSRSEQIGAYMGGGNPLVVCPGALEMLVAEQLGSSD